MKKILYSIPAVMVCMIYALLIALAGGIDGLQPIAYLYISLPILAAVLLRRGKWWGCFFGVVMGAVMLYQGMTAQPQLFVGFVIGLILIAYYLAMGLVCAASGKK